MHVVTAVPTRVGLHRARTGGPEHRPNRILELQAMVGNRAVAHLLAQRGVVQRDAHAPALGLGTASPEHIRGRSSYRALERNRLRDLLSDMVVAGVRDYVGYRDTIQKSTSTEKQAALNPVLLEGLADLLGARSFERCVELLGRRSPTFEELRRHGTVTEALAAAWQASDVGVDDAVTQAHEEGGWIYLDLMDGQLSVVRATARYTDAIEIEPAPAAGPHQVLVATFHTHPHLGRTARPSSHDLQHDARRGVPNLVAGNPGSDPAKFQVFLSGPSARRHLASDTQFPGPSGGIGP